MLHQCLIIDDEPIAQNILKKYIADVPELEVAGVCQNAMEAISVLQETDIDLMFLDIEMPKISGLSFLKTLHHPPATILTTAYREFALEGFELDAIDYLLKPFSFERFLRAVNKVLLARQPEPIGEESSSLHTYFKSDRKYVKVTFQDIIYVEGFSNYVIIHRQDDKKLVVYEKLQNLEESLQPFGFIRIHRSYIISLHHISAFGSDFVELGEKQLTVSNKYRAAFEAEVRDLNR